MTNYKDLAAVPTSATSEAATTFKEARNPKVTAFPVTSKSNVALKKAGMDVSSFRFKKATEQIMRLLFRAKKRILNQQDYIDNTEFFAALTPLGFEAVSAELFTMMGFKVELVGADTDSGDGGKDLILHYQNKYKIFVQCKNYYQSRVGKDKGVGQDVMQNLVGATYDRREDNDAAVLITTGSITPAARNYAQQNGIISIDGIMLEKLMEEVGLFGDAPPENQVTYN